MKKHLLLALLTTLSGCATITADHDQLIEVNTTPVGARCELSTTQGSWVIDQTPGSVTVPRAFEPLMVDCALGNAKAGTMLEAKTRGRAYGNILLLGVPAVVDAGTGAGYEYAPVPVNLDLKPVN